MRKSLYTQPILFAVACAVVGILAARGTFDSMMNFPWIFALVCLILGGLSLRGGRPRRAVAAAAAILLAGAAVAVGGWVLQLRAVEARLEEARGEILAVLKGRPVPGLLGLEPLNTDRATWDQAAALDAKATIVTFWARWCSPCWKEMPELEDLYRQHRDDGLRVLAVTRYERPEDEAERRSDFAKAQEFLERRKLTYPAAITDRDDVYRAYRVRSLPSTALVDERGRVADYAVGLEASRVLMQRAVAMLVETSAE